jgi:hypothetical protein
MLKVFMEKRAVSLSKLISRCSQKASPCRPPYSRRLLSSIYLAANDLHHAVRKKGIFFVYGRTMPKVLPLLTKPVRVVVEMTARVSPDDSAHNAELGYFDIRDVLLYFRST